MNFANLDETSSLNPIGSMLIDKPLLKPIDLLVDRPIDPNVGKPQNKPSQPIVERFSSQTFEEQSLPRDLNEQLIRPKVKPAIKLNGKMHKTVVDYQGNNEERERKRQLVQRNSEMLEEIQLTSQLLDELDNPDVVAKIKEIISDEHFDNEEPEIDSAYNSELISENENLKEQLNQVLNEVKKLKKIAINQKEEINEYMNKNEVLLTENKKMFSKIQKFEYDQKMFTLFTLLNPEVKLSLRGIFKIDTYENFIACGSQRSNIDSLWDFARIRVQKKQFDEIETLNQILLYFIDIFNQTSNTPTIKIQDVAIGQSFDTDAHIKSSDSIKPAGNINKIYLLGYQNATNDKIINKAIVLIGG